MVTAHMGQQLSRRFSILAGRGGGFLYLHRGFPLIAFGYGFIKSVLPSTLSLVTGIRVRHCCNFHRWMGGIPSVCLLSATNHATVNSTAISTAVFLSWYLEFYIRSCSYQPSRRVIPMMKWMCLAVGCGGLARYTTEDGHGFRDSTMLTYWGSVIVEANTTGFAMEFIGDMNDSQTTGK